MNNMDLQSAISTALGNGGWVITEGGAWLTVGYAKTGVVVNKLQKKGSGEQPLRCLTLHKASGKIDAMFQHDGDLSGNVTFSLRQVMYQGYRVRDSIIKCMQI